MQVLFVFCDLEICDRHYADTAKAMPYLPDMIYVTVRDNDRPRPATPRLITNSSMR